MKFGTTVGRAAARLVAAPATAARSVERRIRTVGLLAVASMAALTLAGCGPPSGELPIVRDGDLAAPLLFGDRYTSSSGAPVAVSYNRDSQLVLSVQGTLWDLEVEAMSMDIGVIQSDSKSHPAWLAASQVTARDEQKPLIAAPGHTYFGYVVFEDTGRFHVDLTAITAPEPDLGVSGKIPADQADIEAMAAARAKMLGVTMTVIDEPYSGDRIEFVGRYTTSTIGALLNDGEFSSFFKTVPELMTPDDQSGDVAAANAAAWRGDYDTALYLGKQLAEAGNAMAAFSLGRMYEAGLGVQPDCAEALHWYQLSSGTGYELASLKLRTLEALRSGTPIEVSTSSPDRIAGPIGQTNCSFAATKPPNETRVASLGRRVALVIGNQNYESLVDLEKSAGDARSYGELFRAKGFESVTELEDLTRQGMDAAIAEFIAAINPGDVAVFVYAGHGWSDGKQNFLLGTDAPEQGSAEFLSRISLPIRNGANGIIDEMERQGASLKVAIVDACRDNPFAQTNETRSGGITRGLNRMSVPPPDGTFLVFSAGAGQTALDRLSPDDPNPNGVFTRTFVKYLGEDLTLLDATKATQDAVYEAALGAKHQQQPSFYDETRGNKACLWDSCLPLSTDPSEAAWQRIRTSTSTADFQSFLRLFPDSPHRAEAERMAAPASVSSGPANHSEAEPGQTTPTLHPNSPQAKSLLLEKGVGTLAGSVEWSKGTDGNGLPTIVGEAIIPGRDLSVAVVITKNSDTSLSASHMMEVTFKVSDDGGDGAIASLTGVLLKNDEQETGTPLVGASAPVDVNWFLFALSGSPEDITANHNLLTSRKWIDLALIYEDGKRATMTLEKNPASATLFSDVVKTWNDTGWREAGAYVQLTSQPTKNEARSSLEALLTRSSVLLAGWQLEIREVDLGAKGKWYRVVLPASTFDEATRTCAWLKENNFDCVPIGG